MRVIQTVILLLVAYLSAHAQIGYQVSLLDNATGTPRANETVSITVQITNCEGGTIYSQTSSETTNDFGVLSLTLGNAQTFANVDWTKLPFFVSANVNGVLIGRSQLLSVPVAECALNLRSCKDKIVGRTFNINKDGYLSITFNESSLTVHTPDESLGPYDYFICGNCIGFACSQGGGILMYDDKSDRIFGLDVGIW